MSEIRELAQSSLYFLTKSILGFDALTPNLHQEIAKEIQDIKNNPFLLVILPRKHFKSTIGTIGFPIWLEIQEEIEFSDGTKMKGCDVRTLIANESATNAEHFLSIIEKIWESNELLNLMFPEFAPESSKRKRWNAQEMLINRDATWPEASIETIGVGGAAQSRHYDIRVLDDLIGKEAMDSQVTMDKTIQWYDYSESLSVSPARSICRVYGTRWTKRDLYQHIIDNDKKFKVYSRQCIEDGKPIFPEWYTVDYFDSLRKKNPSHYFSQYCNNPSDPSKCDFKEEWLKYYTLEYHNDMLWVRFSDDDKLLPFSSLDIVGAFDPSIDEKITASRRAIVFAGQDFRSRILVIDTYASRHIMDQVLDAIFNLYAKWRPRQFLIESVAFSKLYLPLIEKENIIRRKENRLKVFVSPTPITVTSVRSKDARIRDGIQQIAAEGRLYVRDTMRDFIEEFISFPYGYTKDVLDAFTHCISALRTPDSVDEMDAMDKVDEKIIEMRSKITGY